MTAQEARDLADSKKNGDINEIYALIAEAANESEYLLKYPKRIRPETIKQLIGPDGFVVKDAFDNEQIVYIIWEAK